MLRVRLMMMIIMINVPLITNLLQCVMFQPIENNQKNQKLCNLYLIIFLKVLKLLPDIETARRAVAKNQGRKLYDSLPLPPAMEMPPSDSMQYQMPAFTIPKSIGLMNLLNGMPPMGPPQGGPYGAGSMRRPSKNKFSELLRPLLAKRPNPQALAAMMGPQYNLASGGEGPLGMQINPFDLDVIHLLKQNPVPVNGKSAWSYLDSN